MSDKARSPRGPVDVAELVAEATGGAPWAVEALAAEYRPRLVNYARARGAVDPEGIADVALTTVLHRLPELAFEAPEPFWAYLCLTARSRLIDEHRRQRPVELVGETDAIDGVGPTALPFDDRVADREYVTALLDPLTDEQRRVLELRFLEDLSVEETANRTGRTKGAVKTMQRRAINAILAAVALVLVVVAVRGFGDGSVGTDADLDDSPASEVDTPDPDDDQTGDGADEQGAVRSDSPEGDPTGGDGPSPDEADDGSGIDESGDGLDGSATAPGDGVEEGAGIEQLDDELGGEDGTDPTGGGAATRIVLSTGTTEAGQLRTTGQPGEARVHGVRISCVAAQVSNDDPVGRPDRPGGAPAQVHWGNTATDATTTDAAALASGAGTCDGGTTDRSAYGMPTVFDADGRAVVPDTILVEYKSFGGPGFDRATLRPIPAGLHLAADPSIAGSEGRLGGPSADAGSRDGDTVKIDVAFPSCVRVDGGGRPVLRSEGFDHLAFPSGADGRSDGCPATHPYRIPQLSYRLTFPVAWASDWSVASEPDTSGRRATVTAWAVAAWEPAAMDDVVTCVRDLLEDCWFARLDRPAEPTTVDPADLAAVDPRPTSRPTS